MSSPSPGSSFNPYGLVSMWREYSYANGWTGEMIYCLPMDQVQAHMQAHWQDKYPSPADSVDQVANQPMTVLAIRDEPWMDGDVIQSAAADPAGVGGLSQNRRVTYRFGLAYLQSPTNAPAPYLWPYAFPQPVFTQGTTLRLELKQSGQFITLPPRAFAIQGGDPTKPAIPPNCNGGRVLVPLTDFVVEWDRVADLGALDFSDFEGCVNQETFLGCEPETLLLETANIIPAFIINPDTGPWAWKVVCNFKRRRILVPTATAGASWGPDGVSLDEGVNFDVFGWNHDFLPGPPAGWQYVLMQTASGVTGGPRYPLMDFTDLFNATVS